MAEKQSPNPMKRVSRACTFCRARKSRCDLDVSGGQPPCGRCQKENRNCVLGTSNRGGSRVRKKTLSTSAPNTNNNLPSLLPIQENPSQQLPLAPTSAPHLTSPQHHDVTQDMQPPAIQATNADEETTSGGESPIDSTIPRNPSDAWQLLKDVAKDENPATTSTAMGQNGLLGVQTAQGQESREARGSGDMPHTGIQTYRLVRESYLTAEIIEFLVQQYFEHYHSYLPLVPRSYFEKENLDRFAITDKHLLTAVLSIASKDLVDQPHIHQSISRYMHDLISGIAAGHDCDVEAVEALLLLAEWEPQGLRNNIEQVGRGEEDRSAWMHVGMALRTGYFLSLDRTAFRQESDEEAKIDARKRFAWANCYVSDRLVSVRVGRAFWSRGPGPMTGLSTRDFPTLQPQFEGDEDYGKIFQAQLDLTQLFSNVHDVLYSGMRSSNQMMLMGDYVKYVDDFRTAIDRWYNTWGNIRCSAHIKVTLEMSCQYLRLYTNAFVFQAQISQAISKKKKDKPLREHLRQVFNNVGALPDARFIWGSVMAAKQFLILLAGIDPLRHLRYMPLRFYLYTIYSAVFLYKARTFGVMHGNEQQAVTSLVHQCIDVLRQASMSPQDAGSRYARLLELLWLKTLKQSQPYATMESPAARSDSQISSSGSIRMDAGGYMQYSPAGFSWLDLEAVGDFVSGDSIQNQTPQFVGMPGYQNPAQYMPSPDAMGWQGQNPMNNFQLDLNGNLLF